MKTAVRTLLLIVSAFSLMEAQIIKTSLTLTVRDELGNTVEEANVRLFETEANYTAEKNPVAEAFTDKKGVVKFKDIQAISYWVIVRKGDMDNAGAGEQISDLKANRINQVTVIIR